MGLSAAAAARDGRTPGPPPAPTGRGDARPFVLVLLAALALAAAAAGTVAGRLSGAPPTAGPGTVIALAAFLALAAALRVELRAGPSRDLLDLTEVGLAPALVLLPGGPLVVLVAVVKAAVQTAQGLPAVKTAYNAAQWAAAAGAGALVLAALRAPGPVTAADVPALLAALAAVVVVNTSATLAVLTAVGARPRAAGVTSTSRGPFGGQTAEWLRSSAVDLVVVIAFGLLAAAVWLWSPLLAAPAAVGLLALHRAGRALAAERTARLRLEGLTRAQAQVAGAVDPRPAVGAFLTELCRACACDGVALHLVESGPGGTTWQGVLRPDGTPSGELGEPGAPGAPGAPEAPEAERRLATLLAASGGPSRHGGGSPAPSPVAAELAALGWRDCLAAPVVTEGRLAGVLVTHDRQGLQGFERGELALLGSAAALLGQALHRGDLAAAVLAERAALRDAQARWRGLVDQAPDLLLVADRGGRVSYAGPSARWLLGRDPDGLRGARLADLLVADEGPAVPDLLAAVTAAPGARRRARLVPAAGPACDLDAVVTNLLDDPAVAGIVVNARDVTESRRAERLRAGQARVLERVARGGDLARTLGLLARVVEADDPTLRVGVALPAPPAARLVAEPALPGPALAELTDLAAAALGAPPEGGVLRASPTTDGSGALAAAGVRDVAVHLLPADPGSAPGGGGPAGAVVLCRSAAASGEDTVGTDDHPAVETAVRLAAIAVGSEHARERLAHQASHDALTGLPNRAVFLDRLARALRASTRSGRNVLVLFLDVDRFKVVNDSLGHAAGDALLRAVAARLRRTVRPGDTVARFGGDEFTMLCEGITDEPHALELVDRVRAALRRPVTLAGQEVFVTTSIGLALGGGDDTAPELLVEQADAAMYRAKERGSAFEVYDLAMRARATRRLARLSALHRAVEQEQFRVVYQPTVSLRTGRVLGAEALVRWDHPEEGLVGPADFIPLAEETGLIVPIGRLVMDRAFAQARAWERERPDAAPTVSVNLSVTQLAHPGLVEQVAAALAESGADPARVVLEITESSLMEDVDASTVVLHRLKDLGVSLVVDDFGTGYSSLSYLQRLPVDGLKVDRSFVAGLDGTGGGAAIVRAVVSLARSLDLTPVAEGVESAAQARRLLDLDCDVAQGFWLGRPVPPAEVSLRDRDLAAAGRTAPPGP